MNIVKNGRYEINGDILKSLSLSKAVKMFKGSIPEDVITEEWEKLNPKRKAKEEEKDSEQES